MNEVEISLNVPQLSNILLDAAVKVNVWGRGTGKSHILGADIDETVRTMPRSVTAIVGKTYTQLLTRTLPSTFKYLSSLGYVRDVDYTIGRRPPKYFKSPYEEILKYDNYIPFANGTGFLLLSQDKKGSSRGPNVDQILSDESLTLDIGMFNEEVVPTNRGNDEIFGKRSPNPLTRHHGMRFVSSAPVSSDQRWLLDYGNYYEEEAGIQIFSIWNRIVKMQLQMVKAGKNNEYALFKDIWNEVRRSKEKISPFVSKDKVLFSLANAFDNIENLGFSYILREYDSLPDLIFLIEILNFISEQVDNCYYNIIPERHVYYGAVDNDRLRAYAVETDYDMSKLSTPDSRFDLDCNPAKPLEAVFDWGAHISVMSIGQESNYDFVLDTNAHCDNVINEFYAKPDRNHPVMINALIDKFAKYYKTHPTRRVIFYHDRYGDHTHANSALTYNNQATKQLEKHGWTVIHKYHSGMEPPQHDKYLLWQYLLNDTSPGLPRVRVNGSKCKFSLISMNNTQVKEVSGKFEKNKKSERVDSGIPPEEATHFGDAVDKRYWTKYGETLDDEGTFVPLRV